LREAGWVAARREGSWIFYRLATMPTWGKQVVAALGQGGVPAAELSQSQQRLTCFAAHPVRANKEEK